MKRIIIAFTLTALTIVGCAKDDGRPKDLPPLFPAEITITQEGNPLAGATVALEATGGTSSVYHPSGITNESGKAVMSTYGFDGVPAGTYKVTVRKTVVEDVKQVTDAYGDLVDDAGVEYRTVEPQFSTADKTPHEIEITNSRKTLHVTFDVGKAIKVRR